MFIYVYNYMHVCVAENFKNQKQCSAKGKMCTMSSLVIISLVKTLLSHPVILDLHKLFRLQTAFLASLLKRCACCRARAKAHDLQRLFHNSMSLSQRLPEKKNNNNFQFIWEYCRFHFNFYFFHS